MIFSLYILGKHKVVFNQHSKCCWNCSSCEGNTYTSTTDERKCRSCPSGYFVKLDNTGCLPVEDVYLKITSDWALVILSCSSLGIVLLFLTLIAFLCFSNTPVIQASRRSLSYVVMIGIGMIFLLPLKNLRNRHNLDVNFIRLFLDW